MRHLATALTAIRRSPYQAMAAILILTITFFVAYCLSSFLYGADKILHYFETRPQVTAFFKIEATPDKIQSLEKSMRDKPYVDTVTVISKEKALEIYREDNKKDPLLLELVTADILPASLEVSGRDVQSLDHIRQDLEAADGVDEVVYPRSIIESLQQWTQSVRMVGIVSVGILGVTSFLIIVIITGMKVATRRNAIGIQRILGATRWYVRAPFVYEGMMYGVMGAIVGWLLMYVGFLYLTPWLKEFVGNAPLLPVPPEAFLIQVGAGILTGMVLGAFASSVAVQRMMKRG